MAESIKSVFDKECSDLKIDARLVKELHRYERHYVNKNENHIEFLGGVLLGTPRIIFQATDRNTFFDEILQVDDVILKRELHNLPTVDPTHKVRSDVLNLSIAYILHRFMTSSLSASQQELGMLCALKIMHYRFLSSLMIHYFPYEPDRAVSEATYNALNNKFSLKQYGSWSALIHARCEDIISRASIHRKALMDFNNDDKIQYFCSDSQGRIRQVVKKMVAVFHVVQNNSGKVMVRKNHMEMEGELHIRDLIRQNTVYKRYIHQVIQDKKSFVRPELISVISDAMHTMPDRHLQSSLDYMADNYGPRGDKNIAPLLDETLLHAFEFIAENRSQLRGGTNLAELITRLRAAYMSSRSTNPSLMKMRDLCMKIVKKSIKSPNESMLASVRTGVLLYIILRTFTMNYYSNARSLEQLKTEENLLVADFSEFM